MVQVVKSVRFNMSTLNINERTGLKILYALLWCSLAHKFKFTIQIKHKSPFFIV
jgi:hypothetical protein